MGQGAYAPMDACCAPEEEVGGEQAVPSSIARERAVESKSLIEDMQEAASRIQVWPMFEDGTLVEYFSATHKAWVPAQIALRLLPSSDVRQPTVVYNIRIKSGGGRVQVRKNIPPSAFRLPLEPGELAEIVSKDWCRWTPCVVDGPHGASRAVGYNIRLATGDAPSSRVFKKVPPVRLRRRFPDGSKVRVFQGSQGGWVQGEVDPNVVDEDPDLDFMGAPVTGANISTASKASCVTVLPSSVSGSWSGGGLPGMAEEQALNDDAGGVPRHLAHSASFSNAGEGLLVDSLWRPVPVRISDAKEARIFPGYLVYPIEPCPTKTLKQFRSSAK